VTVQAELREADSLLGWHKQLLALRRGDPALHGGRMALLDGGNPHVLSYARVTPEGSGIVVALNLSPQQQTFTFNGGAAGVGTARLHTLLTSPADLAMAPGGGRLTLPPYGAWVAALE